jgi:F0F1-type ATP synthase beta subunit
MLLLWRRMSAGTGGKSEKKSHFYFSLKISTCLYLNHVAIRECILFMYQMYKIPGQMNSDPLARIRIAFHGRQTAGKLFRDVQLFLDWPVLNKSPTQ